MYGSPPLTSSSTSSTYNTTASTIKQHSESRALTFLVHASLWTLIIVYALVCPYTKVEESFNIQAIRDIMKLGIGQSCLQNYDHKLFAGVVPRTFIGPLMVSVVARIVGRVIRVMRFDDMDGLLSVRVSVGLVGSFALLYFLKGVRLALGDFTQQCTATLLLTQFHYLYYMSRPLPNTFAAILCLVVFGLFLRRRNLAGLALLSFAGVVFRHELLILVLVNAAMCSGFKLKSCGPSLRVVFVSVLLSALLTAIVDSYFWGHFVIPEWMVFKFNVSPWFWYLIALLASTPISFVVSVLGVLCKVPGWKMIIPSSLYILCFCVVPHKEIRFLFPIYPVFALIAGSFENMLRSKHATFYALFSNLKFIAQLIMFASTLIRVYISSWNYPGGQVLGKLVELVDQDTLASIHVCNLAAMTGFTKFTEDSSPKGWKFDKNEHVSNYKDHYSHLISESASVDGFQLLEHIDAFDAVEYYNVEDLLKEARFLRLRLPFHMKLAPKLFILKNTEATRSFADEQLEENKEPQSTLPTASSTLSAADIQQTTTTTIVSVPSQEQQPLTTADTGDIADTKDTKDTKDTRDTKDTTQPQEPIPEMMVSEKTDIPEQQSIVDSSSSSSSSVMTAQHDPIDASIVDSVGSTNTTAKSVATDPPIPPDYNDIQFDDYEDDLEGEL